MLKSIIGKTYIPSDNSWSINLTVATGHSGESSYANLAGSVAQPKVLKCKIVSEPFECVVQGITTNTSRKMIIVEHDNETFLTLYSEYNKNK